MVTKPDSPAIGILMLQSHFPRIPGDIGNELTWPCPVLYRIVSDASPDRVVRRQAEGLLPAFIEAGLELVEEGAAAITTSCGFLALFQNELSQALPVPVVSSSLMQVELVNRMLPKGKRAGVLTIAASSLSQEHLRLAKVPADTPIGSTEGGVEFTRAILGDETELNVELARRDNINAAIELQKKHADLGAIVLECTNMTPYADDIAKATKLPVFSIVTLLDWLHASLQPRGFGSNP